MLKPSIRRILAAVDFSAPSDKALEYAAAVAAMHGASVHLLHVLEEPFDTQGPWEFYDPDVSERSDRTQKEAETKLSAVAAGFGSGTTVTTEVRTGRPARQIVAVAIARGTDLIVMGTHGRTGLSHVIHGSVAEHVIRQAPCPVLAVCERSIVHQPDFQRSTSNVA